MGKASRRLSQRAKEEPEHAELLTLPVWTSRHHSEQEGLPPERVERRVT